MAESCDGENEGDFKLLAWAPLKGFWDPYTYWGISTGLEEAM